MDRDLRRSVNIPDDAQVGEAPIILSVACATWAKAPFVTNRALWHVRLQHSAVWLQQSRFDSLASAATFQQQSLESAAASFQQHSRFQQQPLALVHTFSVQQLLRMRCFSTPHTWTAT